MQESKKGVKKMLDELKTASIRSEYGITGKRTGNLYMGKCQWD